MPTDVVMPQMGESIAEGTIVRWIKKVGDKVDRDEPLFEISTDKVDAEIPSPAAGVISEIRAKEGETVPVNSVVAVIGAAGEPAAAPKPETKTVEARPSEPPKPAPQADGAPAASAPAKLVAAKPAPAPAPDTIRQRSSPLVRRIAKEHNVDISQLQGTGIAGRVTKDDILGFLGHEGAASAAPSSAETSTGRALGAQDAHAPAVRPVAGDRVEKMSVMRKRIAEHMVLSRRTSAHVHSVFEVNFGRIAQIRDAKKAEFERSGTKLTYLSFIIKAVVDALHETPVVNASIDGDSVIYHNDVNVGIAVALDWGLIVPVIKNADEKNLLGLSRAVADLANRARGKQLKPDEVQDGTFTITNPGVFGALFGMPIINQPQVAILGVGNVEKRPVVINDAIAIRPMAYLTLGYDHRIIDGAVADDFMSRVKKTLENWDPSAV
jgi:pyruvate dehydrogenase E2 component (dihydrolipoyllysine-residue acetyltransferase)